MKFKNYKTKRARLEIRNDRMQNTGTWNSDLACIFFVCLLAPICWYFFIAALQAHAAMNAYKATKNNVPKEPSPPKPSKPMQISVSFNLPNLKGWGQQPQQQPQPNRSKPPRRWLQNQSLSENPNLSKKPILQLLLNHKPLSQIRL